MGAAFWWWPLPRDLAGSTVAPPFGDPLLNAWTLAWGADRLAHGFSGFWQGLFFHPYPDTVAYSEHLLGIAVLTAPVQWLTGNPVLTLNIAMIGATALAGVGMFVLAREVTGRADVAIVAGVAFACSPYRAGQIYHLQVLFSGWMPIALAGLYRYATTRSRRGLWLCVAAFLMQAYTNGYFLYFTAIAATPIGVMALWRWRHTARAVLLDWSVASLAVVLALAPVIAAYVRVRHAQGLVRTTSDMALYSPPLEAYGHVAATVRGWGMLLPTGRQEFELFPGAVVALLALGSLALVRHHRAVPMFAAVGSLALVLSLGPWPTAFGWTLPVPGPYAWLAAILPGLDGLRVPARLATVVQLALCVLAAVALAHVTRRASAVVRWTVAGAVACVIAAEGYAGPLPTSRFPTEAMIAEDSAYTWLREQPAGPVLELPVGDALLATRHMFRTLEHGHPIVNGYSGYGSALQTFVGGPPFTETGHLDAALAMARTIGVRYLVVHTTLYDHTAAGRALADAVARTIAHVADATWHGTVMVATLRPPLPMPAAVADEPWRPVSPTAFVASASHQQDRLALAFDGDRRTRWATAERQQGTEWVELKFDEALDIARVRLDLEGRSFGDYPRDLVVESSSTDGGEWQVLRAGDVLPSLAASLIREPLTPGIDLPLPPNRSRRLRLRCRGQTRVWFWSIHELRLWARDRAVESDGG